MLSIRMSLFLYLIWYNTWFIVEKMRSMIIKDTKKQKMNVCKVQSARKDKECFFGR